MAFQYDSIIVTGAPGRTLVLGAERPATVVTGARAGAIVGAAPTQFIIPRRSESVPVVAGQRATGSGTGNLNETFKVVFLNTGDVALRGDGTIVTARVE
jgi:hypothetical protein